MGAAPRRRRTCGNASRASALNDWNDMDDTPGTLMAVRFVFSSLILLPKQRGLLLYSN